MKFLQHLLTVSLMLMVSLAGGFDLNGISPEMIRPEADDLLSKDYNFRVLNDMSVRRTWESEDNRQLIMDFETKKDRLLSIMLNYRKPVPMEEATKDFLQLTQKEKIKWSKLPKNVAKTIGVHEDSRAMKIGKGYAIMEITGANKCYSISVYPRVPKMNRRALTDVGAIAYGAKAIADNTSEKAVAGLFEDEEKRQLTPGKADLAKSVAAAKAAAAKRRAAEEAEEKTVEDDVEVADVTDTEQPEIATTDKPKKKKKAPEKRSAIEELLAKIGIEELGVIHYAVGGGVVLLILIFIFASGGKKKKKTTTSAMNANMLNATGLRKKTKR